jgi:isopenicillin N synthase-like dioxygenase
MIKEASSKARQSLEFFLHPDGDSNCVPLVKEQPHWNPTYPRVDKETDFEYFQARILGSRAY